MPNHDPQNRPRDVQKALSEAISGTEQYLTAGEVAAALRLHVSTVYELAKRGELVSVRFGRALRFPVSRLGQADKPADDDMAEA